MQVAGAAGQPVVHDQEAPGPVGLRVARAVGHGRLGDVDVVGIAAIAGGDPGEQGGGERREALLDTGHRGGQQDADGLSGQFVGQQQGYVPARTLCSGRALRGAADPTARAPQQMMRRGRGTPPPDSVSACCGTSTTGLPSAVAPPHEVQT
ncbi:hypothetical protein BX264_5421 [Streptomyces sp. 2333.5]|nr:hypothetical protein BX264_5421 [Streptomyces sp. 2333.5]